MSETRRAPTHPAITADADPHLGRRLTLRWALVFVAIALAFVATVIALNATLYSAGGFARGYLDALARQDIAEARSTPGVVIPDAATQTLLASRGLGDIRDIRLRSDRELADGHHRLEFEFETGRATARTTFDVERAGTRFGLFSAWRFRVSPTSVLEVTPVNEASFEANGLSVASELGPGAPVAYTVLTPAVVTLSHESTFLVADPSDTLVLEPGTTVAATVEPRASTEFIAEVQSELDRALDECATQVVLQPTGCPFGERITNRVESTPVWSIVRYPEVTIVPGAEVGTWAVPPTPGTAHLVVDVRSLFDGTLSTFDEDVPFTVSYLLEIDGDGNMSISAQ